MTDVSVVIAAWNAERFVAEAVTSAQQQTVAPLEVVVADDGSTDRTAGTAESLGATVLRLPHGGVSAARNAAIDVSTGDVIAFLDADDVWLPHKLERQLAVLAGDPEVDAVASLLDEFVDDRFGTPAGVRAPRSAASVALASNTIVRRPAVDRIGPFDADMDAGDWVRWWARARRLGVAEHIVPEVLVRRRIHGGNNSVRVVDNGARFLRIAREHRQAQRSES